MISNRELAQALRDTLDADGDLPVPLQALIAATLICGQGGAPSRLGMSKVCGYSYGTSQRLYADLLDVIVERLPAVVSDMAPGAIDPEATARLSEELRRRNETVADLRRELKVRAERQDQVRRYALALHQRLHTLEAQIAAESGVNVPPLHPLP